MPRSKVKLAFLEDYKLRRTSFIRRKENLMKKLEELSILYNVMACVIMYSPFDRQVEVWPNNKTAFQNVLNEFIKMSVLERSRHMVNQVGHIKEKISKVKLQINKKKMQNREMAMSKMISEYLNGKVLLNSLNLTDLNDLVSLASRKLEDVNKKIELHKNKACVAMTSIEATKAPPQPLTVVDGGNASTDWYPLDWIKIFSSPDDTTNDLCSSAYVPSYPPEWIDLLSSHERADNPLWYALFK